MSDLIVLVFDDEDGALEMRDTLVELQKQHILKLDDAAVVVRTQDGKVKVKQAVSLVGQGALGGTFWGLLVGVFLWVPWLGMAVGAVSGDLSDIGVDDEFVKQVGHTIQYGNSALFLLVREATPYELMRELSRFNARVLQTFLSHNDEAKLRATFGAEGIIG
jgi:uncharacterized membrane protein